MLKVAGHLNRVPLQAVSFAALAVALLSPSTAYAQGTDNATQGTTPSAQNATTAGQTRSNEAIIVVTARRRAENAQRVPLTVTAATGDDLQNRSIAAPTDIQFLAPSVTTQAQLTRFGGGYTVRGVTGQQGAGVITYFNEAPGGPTALGMPFFDVNSVQILNGPQGTLFGRSALGGVVLVTPRHPNLNSNGGYLDVTTGDYGRLQLTGVLNVEIIPGELAVRVAYNRDHIDGFTRQTAPAAIIAGLPFQIDLNQRLDEQNSNSFRASVEWRRGAFRNYAVFNYLNVNQNGAGQILSYANPGLATLNLGPSGFTAICTQAFANRLVASVATCTADRAAAMAGIKAIIVAEYARIQAGGSIRQTPAFQGLPAVDKATQRAFVDVAELDLGNLGFTTLRAKNVFSYQEDASVSGYNLDGVGGVTLMVGGSTGRPVATFPATQLNGNAVDLALGEPVKTITEEFQLQGTIADMVNWTGGIYYQRVKQPTAHQLGSLTRTFAGLLTQNLGPTAAFPFSNGTTSDETAYYGQATIDLDKIGIHGLSLTGGYRWTDSKTIARNITAVPNPSGTGPFLEGAIIPDVETTFSGSNYTFGITEQITPDLMVYAALSKSFSPGGRNIQTNCPIVPGCMPTYSPSTVKSYEVGIRSEQRLGDVRLRLNATAFRMDFTDIQQTLRFNSGGVVANYIANVAGAKIQGIELVTDLAWRNLSLSASYSYTDAKFTNWIAPDLNNVRLTTDVCLPGSAGNICLIDLTGEVFQNTPRHQLRGSVRYQVPIADGNGTPWLLLSGFYQSRQWHSGAPRRELIVAANRGLGDVTEAISQRPYGTMNARIGWDNIMGSRFSGSVFVNNLTNTVYSQAGGTRAYGTGTNVRLYAPPRMWGVNLRFEFGGE